MSNTQDKQALKAAQMAGAWWAERLDEAHAAKREAFAKAVEKRILEVFEGKVGWDSIDRKHEGNGKPAKLVCTNVDYDPMGLMLEAVHEVIDPECRGRMFSARGILPEKHSLDVYRDRLMPKEGYGNWTDAIRVQA